jgi:hypothetical protein
MKRRGVAVVINRLAHAARCDLAADIAHHPRAERDTALLGPVAALRSGLVRVNGLGLGASQVVNVPRAFRGVRDGLSIESNFRWCLTETLPNFP